MSEQGNLNGFEIFIKSLRETWVNLPGNKWKIFQPLSIVLLLFILIGGISFFVTLLISSTTDSPPKVISSAYGINNSFSLTGLLSFLIISIFIMALISPFIIKSLSNCLSIVRKKSVDNSLGFENYNNFKLIFAYTIVSLIISIPSFLLKGTIYQADPNKILWFNLINYLFHVLFFLSIVRVADGERNPIQAVLFSIKKFFSLRPAFFAFIGISLCVLIFIVICSIVVGFVFSLLGLIPIKLLSTLLITILSLFMTMFLFIYIVPFIFLFNAQFYDNIKNA